MKLPPTNVVAKMKLALHECDNYQTMAQTAITVAAMAVLEGAGMQVNPKNSKRIMDAIVPVINDVLEDIRAEKNLEEEKY
jgi:uncharacterized protein YjeT (DUF2065 family)